MLRPKSNAFTQASCVALTLGLTIAPISAQNATELPQQKEKKKQEKIVAKEQEKTAQRPISKFGQLASTTRRCARS
jgi:hypothetical protein